MSKVEDLYKQVQQAEEAMNNNRLWANDEYEKTRKFLEEQEKSRQGARRDLAFAVIEDALEKLQKEVDAAKAADSFLLEEVATFEDGSKGAVKYTCRATRIKNQAARIQQAVADKLHQEVILSVEDPALS